MKIHITLAATLFAALAGLTTGVPIYGQSAAPERNPSPAEMVLSLSSISKQHSLDLTFKLNPDKNSVSADLTDGQYANLGKSIGEGGAGIEQLLGNKLTLQAQKPDPAKQAAAKPKTGGALGGLGRVAGAVGGAKAGSAVAGAAVGGAVADSVGRSGGNPVSAPTSSTEKYMVTSTASFSTTDVKAYSDRADLLKMALEGRVDELRQHLPAAQPLSATAVKPADSLYDTSIRDRTAPNTGVNQSMANVAGQIQNIDKVYAAMAFEDIQKLVNAQKMPVAVLATQDGHDRAVSAIHGSMENLALRLTPENFGTLNTLQDKNRHETSDSLESALQLLNKGISPQAIEAFKTQLTDSIDRYEKVLQAQLVKAVFDKPQDEWVQRFANRIGGMEARNVLDTDTPASREAFGAAVMKNIDAVIRNTVSTSAGSVPLSPAPAGASQPQALVPRQATGAKLSIIDLSSEIQKMDTRYAAKALGQINNLVTIVNMPDERFATPDGRGRARAFLKQSLDAVYDKLPDEDFGTAFALQAQNRDTTAASLQKALDILDKEIIPNTGTTPQRISAFKKQVSDSIAGYEKVLQGQLVKAAFDKPHDPQIQQGVGKIGGPELVKMLNTDTPASREAFGKAIMSSIDSDIQDSLNTSAVVRPSGPAVQ